MEIKGRYKLIIGVLIIAMSGICFSTPSATLIKILNIILFVIIVLLLLLNALFVMDYFGAYDKDHELIDYKNDLEKDIKLVKQYNVLTTLLIILVFPIKYLIIYLNKLLIWADKNL